jgi:acyl carrier protein
VELNDPLFQELVGVVARYTRAPRDCITPEGRLIDFGIDSVQAKQLLVDLEAKYSITIEDADVADLDSLGQIGDYLKRRVRRA